MAIVKLFANLRKVAGTREVDIAGANLAAVVSELVKQNPALSGHLLENGQLRPHVIITINGHPTLDMQAALSEQDQIAIFPPIAGGAYNAPVTNCAFSLLKKAQHGAMCTWCLVHMAPCVYVTVTGINCQFAR
jgi:molybdopterin synthase sulfur carrier subunit